MVMIEMKVKASDHNKLIGIILNKLSILSIKDLNYVRRKLKQYKSNNKIVLSLYSMIEFLYKDTIDKLMEKYNTIKRITLHLVETSENITFKKMFLYSNNTTNNINVIPIEICTNYKFMLQPMNFKSLLCTESNTSRIAIVTPLYNLSMLVNSCTIEFSDGVRAIGMLQYRPYLDSLIQIKHPTHSMIDTKIGKIHDPIYLSTSDPDRSVSISNCMFSSILFNQQFLNTIGTNSDNFASIMAKTTHPRNYRAICNKLISRYYDQYDNSIIGILKSSAISMFSNYNSGSNVTMMNRTYVEINDQKVIVHLPMNNDDDSTIDFDYPLTEDKNTDDLIKVTRRRLSSVYGPYNTYFKHYSDFTILYDSYIKKYNGELDMIGDSFDKMYGMIQYTGDVKDLLTEIQYYCNVVCDSKCDWIDVYDRIR